MAKIHNKTHQSNPKPSIFLCCFGSLSQPTSNMASDHTPKPKIHWFSWRRIRKAKSAIKTVPVLDTSLSHHHKHKADQVHPTKIKSKSKSKSQKPSFITTSQTPAANLEPPCQPPSTEVPDVKSNQTSPPTRHRLRVRPHDNDQDNRNRSHGVASPEDNTRQYSVSLPALKRLVIRRPSSSSTSIRPDQTTLNQPIGWENAKRSYDAVVGLSMVVVTLVIMIVWGRLCAILCTSAWLYFIPRFRTSTEENDSKNSKELDLDSEVYKKRVILEGLLERNHRCTL